jgi:hypothetical protein
MQRNKDVTGDLQLKFIPQSEKQKKKFENKSKEEWESKLKGRRGIAPLKLPKVRMKGSKRR